MKDTKFRRVGRVLLCLPLALLAWAAGCSREKTTTPLVRVQTAVAKRMPLDHVVTAEAVLYPLQEAALTPKVLSPLEKYYVNRGARVRQGELLAELQNTDVAAAALENRGAYQQAQANYESTVAAGVPEEMQKAELEAQQTKQAYEAAEKVYRSREDLYKQGAIARKEVDQAGVAATEARGRYAIAQRHLAAMQDGGKRRALQAAEGELTAAKGRYLGAAAQLQFTEIRSPIDGVVTDRPLYPGEVPAAGSAVITVMNLAQVVARAHVAQDEAALLKVGNPATITAPGEPVVPAKVTVVSPALDPNSTTVEVWVQAANPGDRLRPGATVQVAITAEHIPDALLVPAGALLPAAESGRNMVMVVGADESAHQTPVTVGVRQEKQVQILSGLQPGQQVITQGAYGLPDGTKVQVDNQPAEATQTAPQHAEDNR